MCLWGHGVKVYGLKVMCLGAKFTMYGVAKVSVNCHIDGIIQEMALKGKLDDCIDYFNCFGSPCGWSYSLCSDFGV